MSSLALGQFARLPDGMIGILTLFVGWAWFPVTVFGQVGQAIGPVFNIVRPDEAFSIPMTVHIGGETG